MQPLSVSQCLFFATCNAKSSFAKLFKRPTPAVLLKLPRWPHALLTFCQVQNPLRRPRKITAERPKSAAFGSLFGQVLQQTMTVASCILLQVNFIRMFLHAPPPPTHPSPLPKSTASSLASCMCASATELHIHIEWHHVCIQMLMTLSHPQTTQNTQNPTPKHKLCPLGWYLRFPMGSLTAPVTNTRPNRAWKIGSPSLRV